MDLGTTRKWACKIVSTEITDPDQEIQILRSLDHPNVVAFHSFFEKQCNVYIVLELCKKGVSSRDS